MMSTVRLAPSAAPTNRQNRGGSLRAGLYARVSTIDQTPENQLAGLRAFAIARGWDAREYVDHGVSGARERRPALDTMLSAARTRKIDVLVCTKLDRLARSTHHLVTLAKELQALGVDLVVLDQAIDTTTPSGRLLFHMLAAISEFERDLIRDRVLAGIRRARAQGRRFGRPRQHHVDVDRARALLCRRAVPSERRPGARCPSDRGEPRPAARVGRRKASGNAARKPAFFRRPAGRLRPSQRRSFPPDELQTRIRFPTGKRPCVETDAHLHPQRCDGRMILNNTRHMIGVIGALQATAAIG